MSSSQELLWKSYVVVRFWLHLVWLRFNLFLKQPSFIIHARSATFHKIAVVGDGFAEGVGDRVDAFTAAGVARHLQALLDKKRSIDLQAAVAGAQLGQRARAAPTGPRPRARALRARVRRPPPPRGRRRGRRRRARRHDRRACARARARFAGGASGDAAALLAEDDDAFAARVSRDVARLCDALRLLGKRVLLVDLPTEAAVLARERGAIRRVNARCARTRTARSPSATPRATPRRPTRPRTRCRPSSSSSRRTRASSRPRSCSPRCAGSTACTLCSKGYRLLSEALRKAITPHMVAVEWQTWKGMLSSGRRRR